MWIKDAFGDLVNLAHVSCVYNRFHLNDEPGDESPAGYRVCAMIGTRNITLTRNLNEGDAEATMRLIASLLDLSGHELCPLSLNPTSLPPPDGSAPR